MRQLAAFALALAGCTGFQAVSGDQGDGGGADGGASRFTVVQGLPVGETLQAVWGADPDDVFAVGTNGVHWDYYSGGWHRSQASMGRDYYGVWGTSASDVYAVGKVQATGQGIVVHNDGSGWSDQYLADWPLYGIWGTGNAVLAVGSNGMVWGKLVPGNSWGKRLGMSLPANPNVSGSADEPVLWAVAGTSITEFAMPADVDRVFQYIGNGDYVNLDPTVDRSVIFLSIWADPNTPGSYFFGTNYWGIAWLTPTMPPLDATMVTDGMYRLSQDQTMPGSDQMFIRGIWGLDATVAFVGDLGRIYRFDAASGDVVPVASPTSSSLTGIWFSSLDDVWIVGERELILHGSLAP